MTAVRVTSIKAWESILPELGNRRRVVFEAIAILQPCTSKKVAEFLEVQLHTISGRFTELKNNEMIKEDSIEKTGGQPRIKWKIADRKPQFMLFKNTLKKPQTKSRIQLERDLNTAKNGAKELLKNLRGRSKNTLVDAVGRGCLSTKDIQKLQSISEL